MSLDEQALDLAPVKQMVLELNDISNLERIQRNKATLDTSLSLHDWVGLETLPEELFDLTHLEHLSISGFNLKSVPKGIFNLTSLKSLTLRHTFIRKFPISLAKLPNLEHLLFNSFLISEIPKGLEKWTKLYALDLENCLNLRKILSLPVNLLSFNISSTGFKGVSDIIFSLKGLIYLGLEDLGITSLPDELFSLTELKTLYLSGNLLDSLPSELSKLDNLETLVLHNNNLKEFPEVLTTLKNLTRLVLDDNQLNSLPNSVANLQKLEDLDLANNLFTEIPKVLFKLGKLKELDFENTGPVKNRASGNKITYLHPDIVQLKKLKAFSIESTYIENVPAEIITQGIKAIRSYFSQLGNQEQDYLFEAKLLILGEPGAGKTTLTRKLENDSCPLPELNETTRGIDVRQHYFPVNSATFPKAIQPGQKKDFRLNIWDFGGQEIYKATHRFFLSDRAVYLLVANGRNEDTDFTYWLHMVEIFGGKSPLLIIVNEISNRSYHVDATGLRRYFDGFGQVLYVDLDEEDKRRLLDIRALVELLAVKLPHIGNAVPAKWTAIRDAIEANPNNVMTLREYLTLCKANGIAKSDDALVLSQYFHDIGVFLHFQDDELLRKQLFLKPTWATNAVYKVLDHPLLIEQNGRFSKQDADEIWQDDEFLEVKDDLLKLMQRFFITYKVIDANDYIVPEKLPANTPDYIWEDDENLVILYRYEYFMPKGLLTQFMVKKHQYITNQDLVWRRGALLYRQDTVAEVTEPYDSRTIRVKIQGNNKRDFMTIITEELDAINKQYSNLKVEKLIPCNCRECLENKEPTYYEFSDLQTRVNRNKLTIECKRSYLNVNVKGLIDEVLNPKLLSKNKPLDGITMIQKLQTENASATGNRKIFISYAHADDLYLKRLLVHFKVLEHEGIELDVWSDKRLKSGTKWKKEIAAAMQECSVAILLVSTDFLASKFIMEEELPTLLRGAEERGVSIIPIIVSPCRYTQNKDLKEFQAQNDPKNPLSKLTVNKREEEYMTILSRVEELFSLPK